jgi:putative flippase GtrA
LIDLVILNVLLESFGITEGAVYTVLVGVSFIVATCLKYVADKYWAFEKKEGTGAGSEFGKFFIITLISGFIQTGIASLIVNQIGPQFGASSMVWANVGKIAGIAVASIWNFLGYKFVVFKK